MEILSLFWKITICVIVNAVSVLSTKLSGLHFAMGNYYF